MNTENLAAFKTEDILPEYSHLFGEDLLSKLQVRKADRIEFGYNEKISEDENGEATYTRKLGRVGFFGSSHKYTFAADSLITEDQKKEDLDKTVGKVVDSLKKYENYIVGNLVELGKLDMYGGGFAVYSYPLLNEEGYKLYTEEVESNKRNE